LNPTWDEGTNVGYFDVEMKGGEAGLMEGGGGGVKVEIRHVEGQGGKKGGKKKGSKITKHSKNDGSNQGPVYVPLGGCTVPVTPLLSGSCKSLDSWYPLNPNTDDPDVPKVRVQVTYRFNEDPPSTGDIMKFNGHVSPTSVVPVPVDGSFRVDDVVGDYVVLKYETEEEWECTFGVHRYCLVTEEKVKRVVDEYQRNVVEVVKKLSVSPAVGVMVEVYKKDFQDVGLMGVLSKGWLMGAPVVGKWMEEGIDKVVEDVAYATNLDGHVRHDGTESDEEEDEEEMPFDPEKEERYEAEGEGEVAMQGMPHCPITKLPMVHPVVASDGHTYERKAIRRWFEGSDVSPLTGERVVSKEVVVNYSLMERVREEAVRDMGDEVRRAEEGMMEEGVRMSADVEGTGGEMERGREWPKSISRKGAR